ncbi:tyrosine-protein kinase receptor Tie-1-like [Patiria miniata]|uniref:receptor protein-tyrosine kinase n=1 Tax=Patiria miniata TaxID=46514 RepID=A0A913ZWM4_PATMI|nr:tyrosine-protein kinase receptor Tie-1-like [Patiria miniata]
MVEEFVDEQTLTSTDGVPSWWKLDLMSAQCVGKVSVKSIDNHQLHIRQLFEDAVVRAGMSSVPTGNAMCGSPVSTYQAVANNWMEFDCNPPDGLTARYISVDNPGQRFIILCEVLVFPCRPNLPAVDFAFVANPALINLTGGDDVVLTAYKGPDDIPAGVTFGRQLATGGTDGLPPGSTEEDEPSLGCQGRSLRLPAADGINRVGVFYFEGSRGSIHTRIQIVMLPKENYVQIRPVLRTQIANVGDAVRLEMQNVNAPNTNYRWRYNGGDIITSWNDQLSVSIGDVAVSDGGVYSCFVSDQEIRQLHGIMRLIVRGCSDGRWGPPSCLNLCRRCYNGGICDDNTGICVCAPGFSGENCEQVHGRNVFGQTARHRCSNGPTTDPHDDACRGRLFCLPDPYGCSCATGFEGLDCMQDCSEGTYGADCRQTCHCAHGDTCSKDTGECSSDVCDSSYFGINCQCTRRPVDVTPTSISQRSLKFSWRSPLCPNFGTITGFVYTLTDVKSGPLPPVFNTTEKSVTIDGLMPHTVYSFQVAAITAEVGSGTYSEPLIVTTMEAEPSAPSHVNIQNSDDVSITITWSPPNSPNGIITNYDIAYWKSVDAGIQTLRNNVGVSPLVYLVDGLEMSTMYQLQVRAKTSAGAGPWSDTVTASTQNGISPIVIDDKGTTYVQNNVPKVAAIVLGVLLAIAIAVIFIGCVVWRKRDRGRNSAPTTPRLNVTEKLELPVVINPSMHGIESPISDDIERDIYEDVGLPAWAKGLEIQWQNLTIEDKVLGKGNFGEVRAGRIEIKGEVYKVAIKTLKGATTTASEDFLVEFKTMVGIKPHPNVVGLMGACMYEAILYVALEYLPNGNLRDYLRSTRPQQQVAMKLDDGVSPLTSFNLLTFAVDVARGMDHLSDTGIIHRDLAARNILLGEDLTAKISDFGLSRGEDIYVQKSQTRVPSRWLAIESLTRRVYKSKSDVWSFGIVLWEIATFGATPYPGIQSLSLAKRLQEGYRMPKPENCADEIYDLMMKCWQLVPSHRPSFKEITMTLQKMNEPSDENIYMATHFYVNHVIKPEFDDN